MGFSSHGVAFRQLRNNGGIRLSVTRFAQKQAFLFLSESKNFERNSVGVEVLGQHVLSLAMQLGNAALSSGYAGTMDLWTVPLKLR